MKQWFYALLMLAPSALAGVIVENPWAPATPLGASVGGGYLVIRNPDGTPDRLIGASSPVAERVEMHVSVTQGEIAKMRIQQSLPIPANGRLELKPGAGHLMFVGLKQPFKQGDLVPLTLRFERAGEVNTKLNVERLGAHRHAH
ncbi:MAG: copper chaperone PCu(A)C [Betaproteobacteria bacterium]|nr:copper chaperone PCu(A)C [Betaproteobacteria bacterium]